MSESIEKIKYETLNYGWYLHTHLNNRKVLITASQTGAASIMS